MNNNKRRKKTSLGCRVILLLFGIFLGMAILETALRSGEFIFLSMQERKNALSIRQEDAYRILCIGESTTALWGEDAYPYQLEDVLNKSKAGARFRVINKGVPAVNSSAILSRLQDCLDTYKPDMVVAMMGINDIETEYSMLSRDSLPVKKTFFEKTKIWAVVRLLAARLSPKTHSTRALSSISSKCAKADWPLSMERERLDSGSSHVLQMSCTMDKQLKKDIFVKAAKIFKQVLAINPVSSEAYRGLGSMHIQMDDPKGAEEFLNKAIELNPNDIYALIDLGMSYQKQHKYLLAEAAFRKVIELKGGRQCLSWEGGYLPLFFVYKEQKKYAQAEELIQKLADKYPLEARPYLLLAQLYEECGRFKLAQERYGKADELMRTCSNPLTCDNFLRLKAILDHGKIKLVCAQYPLRSIEPLKKIFKEREKPLFVDSEDIFRKAIEEKGYSYYFTDNFAVDFGHCTKEGNRLLAENIARVILEEVSKDKVSLR